MATEEELAAKVVAWLTADQWDVYQEVKCKGGVADIVAVRGPVVWIVEVKRSMTFGLIEQAANRKGCAHFVSVAVPTSKHRVSIVYEVLRYYGIGLITVATHGAAERRSPRMNRRNEAKALIDGLCNEHKTFAKAGNASGIYWTPFKATCRKALELIRADGPMTIKALMSQVQHHYASPQTARASFPRWIREGKVPGLTLDESKRPYMIRLMEGIDG